VDLALISSVKFLINESIHYICVLSWLNFYDGVCDVNILVDVCMLLYRLFELYLSNLMNSYFLNFLAQTKIDDGRLIYSAN